MIRNDFISLIIICRLLNLEKVKRTGAGGRTDPYIYTVSLIYIYIFGSYMLSL